MIKNALKKSVLKNLAKIEYGGIEFITPEGQRHVFKGNKDGHFSTLHLKDWWALPAIVAKGDIGLAESYRDGKWHCSDLTSLLLFGLQNVESLSSYIFSRGFTKTLLNFSYLFSSNTLKGSKKNIYAHYDLGNQFYQLWLDESLTYSSAIYHDGTENLTTAQYNKYDRIIDLLENKKGRLLEIGCGWGGFCDRALYRGNYDCTAITISQAQYQHSQTRLKGRANVVLQDYREQKGLFDYIVSIEMFEAVGERYWPVYFKKIAELLDKGGKAVIQTIVIDEQYFEEYRKGTDVIRSYIFPGGMLPSKERLWAEIENAGLKVKSSYAFGRDYAKTLMEWLTRFDAKIDDVKAQGFDEKFIRIWRFYLAFCIAGFDLGRTDVLQVEVVHA